MARYGQKKASTIGTIARRTFLIGSTAIAGGAAFGVWAYKTPYGNPLQAGLSEGEAALTPYVKIDQDGITIITPRAEMGQGIHTTLAALVAEELDVSLDAVRVEHGPASKAYFNDGITEEATPFAATDHSEQAERVRGAVKKLGKILGMQITGGSSSIPDGYIRMRSAGAAARAALIGAAANQWGVDPDTLRTEDGEVVSQDGKRLAYTQLAVAAAEIKLPEEPELKPRSEWKILGKTQPRVDMVGKATGTAQFSIDVRFADMLYAAVKMGPYILCPVSGHDASEAERMPGVKKIVPLGDGVGVVATNTWNAMQAAKTIEIEYATPNYPMDTAGQKAAVAAAFDQDADGENRNDGNVGEALGDGDIIEREYFAPYLAHATMEPMNAAVLLKDGRLDIWVGNQLPTQILVEAKKHLGIAAQNVHVHTTLMGGAFGRRAEMDYIIQALHIAKSVEGTPIKLTWTREDDMRHDAYRPMAMARFKAKVDGG